jgi:phosphatidate phosphatase APP1/putative sterol carrier protein
MRKAGIGFSAREICAVSLAVLVVSSLGARAVEADRAAPIAYTTVKEIFADLPSRFNADAGKGINAVVQYHLAGEAGGDYYVVIKDGTCQVNEGTHPSPNMTETMAAQDYVDMKNGRLNGQMAFMSGKLKIAGDMGLAMKMESLFRRPPVPAKDVTRASAQQHTRAAQGRDGPAAGQQIVFFPSPASVSPDGKSWLLKVQGRIFEPAARSQGRKLFIDAIAKAADLDDDEKKSALFHERAGYFLSDSEAREHASVAIGDQTFRLPASDNTGYFGAQIAVANDDAVKLAKDGVIAFQSLPTAANPTVVTGQAVLVPDEGISIVTDMDDTIKDTHVLDRKEMLKNTFVRRFVAVAGMPELYRSWKEALGARVQFHVVSAGPWQLNEPLRQFAAEAGFPPFTWHMRSVDINVAHLRELTAKPYAFKVTKIRELMKLFPKRHFVCVGDSGEQDPEVYSKILSEFPDRVDAVFIRDVTEQSQDAARYQKLFRGAAAAKLRVFRDPKDLPVLGTLEIDTDR